MRLFILLFTALTIVWAEFTNEKARQLYQVVAGRDNFIGTMKCTKMQHLGVRIGGEDMIVQEEEITEDARKLIIHILKLDEDDLDGIESEDLAHMLNIMALNLYTIDQSGDGYISEEELVKMSARYRAFRALDTVSETQPGSPHGDNKLTPEEWKQGSLVALAFDMDHNHFISMEELLNQLDPSLDHIVTREEAEKVIDKSMKLDNKTHSNFLKLFDAVEHMSEPGSKVDGLSMPEVDLLANVLNVFMLPFAYVNDNKDGLNAEDIIFSEFIDQIDLAEIHVLIAGQDHMIDAREARSFLAGILLLDTDKDSMISVTEMEAYKEFVNMQRIFKKMSPARLMGVLGQKIDGHVHLDTDLAAFHKVAQAEAPATWLDMGKAF